MAPQRVLSKCWHCEGGESKGGGCPHALAPTASNSPRYILCAVDEQSRRERVSRLGILTRRRARRAIFPTPLPRLRGGPGRQSLLGTTPQPRSTARVPLARSVRLRPVGV